jgi:hypothetical protein
MGRVVASAGAFENPAKLGEVDADEVGRRWGQPRGELIPQKRIAALPGMTVVAARSRV